jgi:F-type H+-transporting ATPase subunit delta
MSDRSVAKKYASALFHLASQTGAAARVRGDLEAIVKVLAESPGLEAFLVAPNIVPEQKTKLVERAFKGRVDEATLPFLFLMLKRDRIALLPDILSEFVKIDEEKSGIQRAKAVSAVPLSEEEKSRIVARLKRISGKEILLESRVDPEIIGGVIVYVNGDVIDGSIRNQLAELRTALLAVSVP